MTIDWWTIGIQTVNVLILVWLLGWFFWRPVAAMIEQRRVTAQRMLAEAEEKSLQATASLADIERTRAGFAREREAILSAARETAEQAHAARLTDAAKEAASLEAAARKAIGKEKEADAKAWAERSSRLAVEIAERLVARLNGPTVSGAFLDGILKEIKALPDTARQAAAGDGVALEAVSAAPLDPADQERCRGLIAEAFEGCPVITFRTDPELIAGLELRGPQLIVRNSWRDDLTHILADLMHDDRH